jgi:hypothetical protein
MSKDMSAGNYKHDASDRKLDHAADDARAAQSASGTGGAGAGHDPAEIAKHDDAGKDRLFEGRQQHDDAEKNSEKSRLAKDVQAHHHPVSDDVADAGTGASAKRKS